MSSRGLQRALLPAALALLMGGAITGGRAASSARLSADPQPFVGTWIFRPDANIVASCGGEHSQLEPLGGVTVAVSAGTDDTEGAPDLYFDLGCHCHLPLYISSSDPTMATLVEPTSCELLFGLVHVTVEIETLTLSQGAAGTRTLEVVLLSGATAGDMMCDSASVVTSLLPSSSVPADCGPESTALGVLSYALDGFVDCPLGAGRDSVHIRVYDEKDTICIPSSGSHGEGGWVLPQTSKYASSCEPSPPGGAVSSLRLSFCRVDGRSFKPLTTDPTASDQFYAVLKLGDGDCPPPAVEIVRKIDTEDDLGDAMDWTGIGHLGPNQVATPADSTTILHFCFFRWAAAGEATMATFPDLGFPYAVFHDFDGPQPPWVTLKRWLRSSDESSTNHNGLTSPADDFTAVSDFRSVIEPLEPQSYGTIFDVARVR